MGNHKLTCKSSNFGCERLKIWVFNATAQSTNITNNAQLLVYARYTTRDNDVKTELLISKRLSSTTKGKDIFEVLDNFFKQNELDWKKLIGCTTSGAPSMLGT